MSHFSLMLAVEWTEMTIGTVSHERPILFWIWDRGWRLDGNL